MLDSSHLRGRWVSSWTPYLAYLSLSSHLVWRGADVSPFRFAGVIGGSLNCWFGVEADGFLYGCSWMRTNGASFD